MGSTGGTTGAPVTGGVVLGGDGIGLEPTLLAPARYAQIMGIPLPHFMQQAGALAPLKGGCDDVWDQNDREALVYAIGQAEEMIAIQLGFWPAPKWIVDELIPFGLTGVRSDWRNAEVSTRWGKVIAFGTQVLTLLQQDAIVTYTDDDDDNLARKEMATIGAPLVYSYLEPCADACAPRVYFRTADGAWDAADPRFEIRNLRTDIDGGLMYLKGESSMFIQPARWTLTRLESTDDSWRWDFDTDYLVSYVDVYCESTDYDTPVTIRWDGVCGCTSPCSHYTQAACAYVTDYEHGLFIPRPATYSGGVHTYTGSVYQSRPESVVVSYLAGYPLDPRTCRINRSLERAIVALTNVLLPEPPCGYCDLAQRRWTNDRKRVDPITVEAAGLPWGMYEQGALEAWRIVRTFMQGRGGKMGRS